MPPAASIQYVSPPLPAQGCHQWHDEYLCIEKLRGPQIQSVKFMGETYAVGHRVQLAPYSSNRPTKDEMNSTCSPKETEFWMGTIKVRTVANWPYLLRSLRLRQRGCASHSPCGRRRRALLQRASFSLRSTHSQQRYSGVSIIG